MNFSVWRSQWMYNPVREMLAGMVGTFALIPEVIAFSYVAGVSPAVSLYASFVISVAIAVTGGRPGMISGAAGSVALVAADLVHKHGVDAMLLATLMAGAIQIFAGMLGFHVLMRFISKEVRTGFVNALAILIFSAQVPQMLHVTWHTWGLIALGLLIIYLLPRLSSVIPSPLICIVILTAITCLWPMPVHTVADLGDLPTGLPALTLPHIPLTLQTFEMVLPYALAMAAVGLLESLMTARVVDDMTGTHGNAKMEATGLGISNILVGMFGGIAGCGMIGQTIGNLRYGGQGRLSTFTAGAFLLLLMVALHSWVARVPMAALVAIMIMVSISTFAWGSLKDLFRHPKLSALVMIMTVFVTVLTHDLAAGVVTGVLLSGVFFAWHAIDMLKVSKRHEEGIDIYTIRGEVFFASVENLMEMIDLKTEASVVVLKIGEARFRDVTAVESLEKIISGLQQRSIEVRLEGLQADQHGLLGRVSDLPLLQI